MGGKERMFDALSMLFGEHTDGKSIMHNAANEVELHAPYLFNFVCTTTMYPILGKNYLYKRNI